MNSITLKWIISIIVSVGIGTFIMNVLGNAEVNIWISRIIGAVVAVIIELSFYYSWIRNNK